MKTPVPHMPNTLPSAIPPRATIADSKKLAGGASSAAGSGMKNVRLLNTIKKWVQRGRKYLNLVYYLASTAVSLWGMLLAAGAALAGHWALCAGQFALGGGLLAVVKQRRDSFESMISRAEDLVEDLEADIFDIISEILQAFAGEALDTSATSIGAAAAPIALSLPATVQHYVPGFSWWAIHGAVVAAMAAVSGAMYGVFRLVKKMALRKVDDIVDHIDDMPMFDFLSGEDEDDPSAGRLDEVPVFDDAKEMDMASFESTPLMKAHEGQNLEAYKAS